MMFALASLLLLVMTAQASSFAVDDIALNTVTVPGKLMGNVNVTVNTRVVKGDAYKKHDVVFFIGFADCVMNHEALFEELTDDGYGVYSFDYPGHGGSPGSINDYTIGQLGHMGSQVYQLLAGNTGNAVHLVGWSTGGLVVVRALQDANMYGFSEVESAVMYSPGVKVYPLIGTAGVVTADTLTNNPSANVCPIKPSSPLLSPLFAADLLLNAGLSWTSGSIAVRSLVIVGGDTEDKYVITSGVKSWVGQNQCGGPAEYSMGGIQCAGAKHELDNEPSPVGDYVRTATVEFLNGQLNGDWGTGCQFFNPTVECFAA
jgi:pimeloyl-ACP methyl ester carboxylesterase